MGQPADFICLNENCKHEWEYIKEKITENFPEHPVCPKCGSVNTQRLWSHNNIITDVAQGKSGNYKNDYTSGKFYHSSKIGKFKGTTVKTIE